MELLQSAYQHDKLSNAMPLVLQHLIEVFKAILLSDADQQTRAVTNRHLPLLLDFHGNLCARLLGAFETGRRYIGLTPPKVVELTVLLVSANEEKVRRHVWESRLLPMLLVRSRFFLRTHERIGPTQLTAEALRRLPSIGHIQRRSLRARPTHHAHSRWCPGRTGTFLILSSPNSMHFNGQTKLVRSPDWATFAYVWPEVRSLLPPMQAVPQSRGPPPKRGKDLRRKP